LLASAISVITKKINKENLENYDEFMNSDMIEEIASLSLLMDKEHK
jgi:hypothetical protein